MFKNYPLILKALRFAEEKHKGQKRKVSGEDYISHPIAVSYLASNFKKSKNLVSIICAAILHDTVEDTHTSYPEILEAFGMEIACIVFELTSDEKEIDRIGKGEYLKKKLCGISSYSLFLKLCDRLSNIMDNPSEKQIIETQEILSYLKKNRKLSKSHKAVIAEIENILSEKENQNDQCTSGS
jgi:guanosine-3',5'-bis(diphosphate) 3'-pyrophosphohydrolase